MHRERQVAALFQIGTKESEFNPSFIFPLSLNATRDAGSSAQSGRYSGDVWLRRRQHCNLGDQPPPPPPAPQITPKGIIRSS
jgi:hypothetical protein